MAFRNWDEDGLDIYKRRNWWEVNVWTHYAIDDQTEPANWHKAQTMRFIGNDVWTIYETAMNAMTPIVDAMSSNAL